jgi:hypothetical protein
MSVAVTPEGSLADNRYRMTAGGRVRYHQVAICLPGQQAECDDGDSDFAGNVFRFARHMRHRITGESQHFAGRVTWTRRSNSPGTYRWKLFRHTTNIAAQPDGSAVYVWGTNTTFSASEQRPNTATLMQNGQWYRAVHPNRARAPHGQA